jgi:pyruvate/2-oxoglutarate dehydrogenase complex dihydrolipoamide acyltransferase (E2) component
MAFEVKVPQLTQTMTEAQITHWLKREGEKVQKGEPLLEVVTDKATLEVESPFGGVLSRILIAEGEAAVGTVIGVIASPDEVVAPAAAPAPMVAAIEIAPVAAQSVPATQAAPIGKIRISPLARRMATDRGVDLARLTATGPGGLIVEADVRRFLEIAPALTPRPAGPLVVAAPPASQTPTPMVSMTRASTQGGLQDGEEVIPLIGVRKIIADRLSLSRHTAADVTTVAEVDMGEVAAFREHVDITYTAFVARAVTLALTEYPILNSRLDGDRIIVGKRIHLGVAVAIDDGLKVPVIWDAQTKSLRQMGLELGEKAKRGAEGRLTPEELTGSSFTLTNSGVFGSLFFTPIINPPESAILGVGKIAKTPVVRNDQIVIRPMMYLCLTYDHRVVDGAPAVKFLQKVKSLLEKPELLL